MRRKLFTLCAAASLLLCVVVCVMWVRGRRSADWFHWTRTGDYEWRRETLVAGGDGIYVSHQWFHFDRPGHAREYAAGLGDPSGLSHMATGPQKNPYAATFWNRLGFGVVPGKLRNEADSDGAYRYIFSHAHVPYWFVLIVSAVPACIWLARARARSQRARRARLGQCARCGYDLRATPEKCPECGAAGTMPTSAP